MQPSVARRRGQGTTGLYLGAIYQVIKQLAEGLGPSHSFHSCSLSSIHSGQGVAQGQGWGIVSYSLVYSHCLALCLAPDSPMNGLIHPSSHSTGAGPSPRGCKESGAPLLLAFRELKSLDGKSQWLGSDLLNLNSDRTGCS